MRLPPRTDASTEHPLLVIDFARCGECGWSRCAPTESEARAAAAVHVLQHRPATTTAPVRCI